MNCSRLIATQFQVCISVFFIGSDEAHEIEPGSTPPSLLLNVSGSVVHGKQHQPAANQRNPTRSVDGLSRVFSQVFMLVPDPNVPPNPEEGTKYYVSVDALRFVG